MRISSVGSSIEIACCILRSVSPVKYSPMTFSVWSSSPVCSPTEHISFSVPGKYAQFFMQSPSCLPCSICEIIAATSSCRR